LSDWLPAPIPHDESDRIMRLARIGLREGRRYDVLDHLTRTAAAVLRVPTVLVSIVESERQHFVSRFGLDATETPRPESFCGHAIHTPAPFEVADAARDPRFAHNPLVVGQPHVAAYLGVPLLGAPGQSALGTLCAIDTKPRVWSAEDRGHLVRLAHVAERYLEGLVYVRTWEDSPLSLVIVGRDGRIVQSNPAFSRMTGRSIGTLAAHPLSATVLPGDRAVLERMVQQTLAQRKSPPRRELRFLKLSGEIIPGGLSVSPLADVEDHVVCVIRDISLDFAAGPRAEAVLDVRQELAHPLNEARTLLQSLTDAPEGERAPLLDDLRQRIDQLDGLLDARIGDISARVRAEDALRVSERQLRSVVESAVGLLLVIDTKGRLIHANRMATERLGWSFDALLGASLQTVCPTFSAAVCERWYAEASPEHGDIPELLLDLQHIDGSMRTFACHRMILDWDGPGRLVLLGHDISDEQRRTRALVQERDDLARSHADQAQANAELVALESAMKRALHEKETLLKEIHHRVKNNLQIVSSLLTLQLDQVPEPTVRALLTESVHRVRSMALIHQSLYGGTALDRVAVLQYAESLAQALRSAFAPGARVQVYGTPLAVAVEQAIPVGLILNELLTNAFKYGVRAARDPELPDVVVQLHAEGDEATLEVRDRGPGLPANFEVDGCPSLGLTLVTALTRQLGGQLTFRNEGGAVFAVRFRPGPLNDSAPPAR
jgi:PAS domain S-box-containing protein